MIIHLNNERKLVSLDVLSICCKTALSNRHIQGVERTFIMMSIVRGLVT